MNCFFTHPVPRAVHVACAMTPVRAPLQVVEMCSQYKRRTRALQQSLVDSQRQVEIGKTQIVQLSKLMAKATITET